MATLPADVLARINSRDFEAEERAARGMAYRANLALAQDTPGSQPKKTEKAMTDHTPKIVASAGAAMFAAGESIAVTGGSLLPVILLCEFGGMIFGSGAVMMFMSWLWNRDAK